MYYKFHISTLNIYIRNYDQNYSLYLDEDSKEIPVQLETYPVVCAC